MEAIAGQWEKLGGSDSLEATAETFGKKEDVFDDGEIQHPSL